MYSRVKSNGEYYLMQMNNILDTVHTQGMSICFPEVLARIWGTNGLHFFVSVDCMDSTETVGGGLKVNVFAGCAL